MIVIKVPKGKGPDFIIAMLEGKFRCRRESA